MQGDWEEEDYTAHVQWHADQHARHGTWSPHAPATAARFDSTAGEHLRQSTLEEVQRMAAKARRQPFTPIGIGCQNREPVTSNREQLDQWVEHEIAWNKVLAEAKLHPSCVPWPPHTHSMLECMAQVEAVQVSAGTTDTGDMGSSEAADQLMKRAYLKAVRRWHPDKLRAKLERCEQVSASQDLQQQQQQQQQAVEDAVKRATEVLLAVQQQWLERCSFYNSGP